MMLKLSLILLLVLKLNSAKEECHVFDNYCIFVDSYGGHMTYNSAKTCCEKHGGRLAVISHEQKNDFILYNLLKLLSSKEHVLLWFGLRKEYSSRLQYSPWRRSDNSVLLSFQFDKWTTDHDADYNADKDCVTIDTHNGFWHRTNCHGSHQAICEIATVEDCAMSDISINYAQFDKCGESTTVKTGTNILVSCNPGYILHGPVNITCTHTGWSEIPTCVPGCLPPELPDGIKIFNNKSEYKTGEELLIFCEHGYLLGDKHLKTHHIVKCDSDGTWPFLKYFCISDQQLKCQDHVCTEISLFAELNSTVILKCPLIENGTYYSHFRWIKNHVPILTTETNYSINETGLYITHFNFIFVGTYSCVRGFNDTNADKVIVYDVKIRKLCRNSGIHNLPTVKVNEGESLYLYSSSAGSRTAINWFKDDTRLIANKGRSILPNGDVLINTATLSDQGQYKFEVEKELPHCFDEFTIDVYVKAQAHSVCGMSDDKNGQPWLVPLISQDETVPFCYGTLINEQWIISSAFCLSRFYRRKTNNVVAQFRIQANFSVLHEEIWDIQAEQFIVHPQYSRHLNVNNIGLVKLKERVTFSKTLKPICLSFRDFQTEHENLCDKGSFTGIVAGWGSIEALTQIDMGPVETENLTVVSKENCQKYVAFEFPNKMFCVSQSDENDTGLAKLVGDSGSPFLVSEHGRYYLQGVFSWGERIAQVGNYDYFTKVASYYDWIRSNVQ